MATKFEKALNAVIKLNEIPQTEHNAINDDIDTIADEIYQTLKRNDSLFKDVFKELKSTATYTKNTTFEIPVDYEIALCFELPFKVQTKFLTKDHDILVLQTNVNHPIVENGFINAKRFEILLYNDLNSAITKMKSIQCTSSGRNYKLELDWDECIGIWDIKATEEIIKTVNDAAAMPPAAAAVIKFVFKPLLKFLTKDYPIKCNNRVKNANYWLAHYEIGADEHILSTEVPRWQLINKQDRLKIRNALRLSALFYIKTGLFESNEVTLKAAAHILIHDSIRFETKSSADMFTHLIQGDFVLRNKKKQENIEAAVLKRHRKQIETLSYFMDTDIVRIKNLLPIFGLL